MTLAAKQRLVVAVLAVLAAWPLAHRALVARYDLDPWRFFGWAMYCTPKLPAEVRLFAIERGERVEVPVASLSPPQRRAVDALRDRRAVWGTLASPARAAAALLDARPDAAAVEVVVEKWYLDPATASIATHVEPFRVDRGER
ncbi:hypothetical protein KF840_04655 [bacterium]|nr:hypothetical protein [bacterium]